jgi:hypothetical protein
LIFWLIISVITYFIYSIVYFSALGIVFFWLYVVSIAVAMLMSRRQIIIGVAFLIISFLTKDWLIFGSDIFQYDYIYPMFIVCFVKIFLLVLYSLVARKLKSIIK